VILLGRMRLMIRQKQKKSLWVLCLEFLLSLLQDLNPITYVIGSYSGSSDVMVVLRSLTRFARPYPEACLICTNRQGCCLSAVMVLAARGDSSTRDESTSHGGRPPVEMSLWPRRFTHTVADPLPAVGYSRLLPVQSVTAKDGARPDPGTRAQMDRSLDCWEHCLQYRDAHCVTTVHRQRFG